ncbi:MAG: photosystem II protein PsbQ [Richelia sp. RM2_1_2]|nr:photosystem II protein PsbQ [Richelia sp. SM1_7_0]NJN10950.1 photosystem II protein PsbQ [Richelia sp. RM1_1_1]NJO29260.1 photosystem II protein PsbQ [Richelia sp. SL_2_1]NJO61593.1 photosystem II protein PsbQ [Richelia sp. RM2_1_2]
MSRLRPIFSLILVSLATLLISCGSANVAATPPTYTPLQIEKIQEYAPKVVAVQERSAELQKLIQNQDWINVGNFIHGPMTEVKLNMSYIVSNLLPEQQKEARKIAREMFNNLVKIDQAANEGNSRKALSAYDAAFADINQFLDLLPANTISN